MNALLQWFTSAEWTLAVKALLHTLWQGAIIAITLGLAMRRVANPANRYRLSFGALASVMLIAVLTWAWLNRPEPDPGVVAATPAVFIEQPPPVISDGLPPIVVTAIRQESKPAPAGWTAWLALVWLAGAAAMLGRVGFQVAGAERLRRSCKPLADERVTQLLAEAQRAVRLTRKIRVAVTDRLTSPAVVGVIVPTLILPLSLLTALTPEQLRFVLLHELAHIRRGDYFANLFQLFMEALLFFNPAVWWISHLVRREREACCDALAIELSGAPVDYAKTLVQVAENILDNPPAAAPAFGGADREPSQLADRVQRLLVPGYRPSLRLTWRAMLAALLVGGALLFLSALGARNVVGAVTNNATESPVKSEDKSGINEQITSTRPGDSTNIRVTDYLNSKSPLEFTYPFLRTNRTQQTNGPIVRLNGLDSFATPELDPSVGMNSWKVSGRDQLQRQWFWYRTAPSPAASVSTTNAVVSSPFGVETDLSKHLGLGSNWSDVILSGSFMTVVPSYLNSSNFLESIDKAEIEIEGGNAVRDLEGRLTAVTNGVRVKLTASGQEFTADSVQFDPITGNVISARNFLTETKDGTRIQSGNINWFSETNNAGPKQHVRIRLRADQETQSPAPTPSPPQPEPTINKDASSSAGGLLDINSSARQTAAMATRTYAVGPMELARALGMTGSQVATNATQNSSKSVEVTNSATTNQRRISERTVTLTDGASTAQVNPDSEPGVSTWTVDGEDQLYEKWFRYRAGTNKAGPDEFFPKVLDKGSQDVLQGLDPWGNPYIIVSDLNQPAVAGITDSSTRTIAADSNALALFTRTYKLDINQLVRVFGLDGHKVAVGGSLAGTNEISPALLAIRNLFSEAGIVFGYTTGNSYFFHDRDGRLLVRATKEDLDKVEKVIQSFNTPPQVNIKARFIEVPFEAMPKVMGLLFTNSVAVETNQFAQVLTAAQHRRCLKELDNIPGVHLLASPEVTTLSGRQAQLQVMEMKTVVIGLSPVLTNGVTNMVPMTQTTPFGPTLDVIPFVSANGYTAQMTLIPTVTEFLGYDDPGRFQLPTVSPRESQRLSESRVEPDLPLVSRSGGASRSALTTTPLPRYRVRQMVTNVVVWSGQAVVLGNFPNTEISTRPDGTSVAEELGAVPAGRAVLRDKVPLLGDVPGVGKLFRSESAKDVKKQLLVFVVPTLIDSAGNPIYPGVQVDGPNPGMPDGLPVK